MKNLLIALAAGAIALSACSSNEQPVVASKSVELTKHVSSTTHSKKKHHHHNKTTASGAKANCK